MTDIELLQKHRDGSDQAFADLVQRHLGWVYGVARRRLRDNHLAEDVAQAVFVLLHRKSPQFAADRTMISWLYTATCYATQTAARDERRRKVRETEAAVLRSQTENSAEENEWRELAPILDEMVAKLSRSDREAILLRYYRNLTFVELGAEVGITADAARKRVDRAVEKLRQMAAGKGIASSAMIPIFLANHIRIVPPNGLLAASTVTATAAPGSALAASTEPIIKGVLAVASLKTNLAVVGIIAALLLLAGGGAGMWWLMTSENDSPAQAPLNPVASVTPAPPAPAAITINPTSNTNIPATPNWNTAPADTQRDVLAGRVLDQNGQPVVGAAVTLEGPRGQMTKTDAQGNYAFRTLRGAGGDYTVGVAADGFIPIQPYLRTDPALQLSTNSQARRNFVLQRGVTVLVHTRDADGKPMRGASVDAVKADDREASGSTLLRQSTDKTGKTKFTIAASQIPYTFSATRDGCAPSYEIVHATSTDQPLEVNLVLNRGLNIKGTAICSDKKPAVGWNIYAQPDWWITNYIPKQELIDKDGSFTLTSVGPGIYSIFLLKNSSITKISTMTLPPTTQPIRIDLPMPSPASLVKATGRIHLIGGRPDYINADVTGLSSEHGFVPVVVNIGPVVNSSVNIPRGEAQYTFTADPGSYSIRFQSPSIEPVTIDKVDLPGELPTVTLKVVSQPRITGTVTDASTGAPVTHFAVRVRKVATLEEGPNYVQEARWTQVGNSNGRFDVECVGLGIYEVQVSVDGYVWLWSPQIRLEKDRRVQDISLHLTRGGSLGGTILDPSGKPVAEAKIIPLSMASSAVMGEKVRFENEAGAVLSDAAGKFTLPHLGAGDETIKVVHSDFAPAIVSNLKIAEGKLADAGTISLNVGGAVEGTVYNSNGKPSPNVTLQFQDADGYGGGDEETAGRFASVISDDAGRYHIDHLPNEIMWVNLSQRWEHHGVVRRVVRPIEGKTAHLDFGGIAPVTGRLTFHGQPLANIDVELTLDSQYSGPTVVSGATDSNGNFTFFGPPQGRYTLYCSSESRSQWLSLREIEVGDEPLNLGEINLDTGDVIIHFTADDPSDLGKLQYVSIAADKPDDVWPQEVCRAELSGDHWLAKNVPAGKFSLRAYLKDATSACFSTPIERKTNADETEISLHIPKRTATLSLIDTHPTNDSPQFTYMIVRRDDSAVQASIFTGQPTVPVKLPPGTYQFINSTTAKPEDIPPITLKDGDTRELRQDFTSPNPDHAKVIRLTVWTSDGILVTFPRIRLIDAKGIPIQSSTSHSSFDPAFQVHPGTYQAEVDRPGLPPFIKQIDVPALNSAEKEVGNPICIVLP